MLRVEKSMECYLPIIAFYELEAHLGKMLVFWITRASQGNQAQYNSKS